jgi:cytochrome c-type biogenesis protein CcmH
MVSALAERLKAQPDDAEGWLMLGRSYTVLGRYRDAATALRRAQSLLPGNPEVLTDLADVVGMAQGKRLSGEPARLVQQALDINPRHVKALALAGSVSFEARDYGAARQYWQRLLAEVPADSPVALSFRGSINEASALESGRASTTAVAAAPAATTVRGRVEVSAELASRLAPGDTLFVFARAEQGPRMPLAILRRNLPALPFEFALDDSMAMSPDLKLSGFARVIVSARVSRSGNATPQGGDLVGQSVAVAPGAEGLRLVIDHVQP